MRRPLLLLLLVLVQLLTSNFVGAKEDVSNSEKKTKTSEKSEKGEKEEKEEEEEDSCLSSPCGSHARCKNVQVCQIIFAPECFVTHVARKI